MGLSVMRGLCGRIVLIVVALSFVSDQTAAQQCVPGGPGGCPDGQVCGPGGQCDVPGPNVEDNQLPYIIMGVVLGVVVILTIIILVISCGRWRFNWMQNMSVRRRRVTVVRNGAAPAPRRPRKMRLKFGMKQKNFPRQYQPEGTHSVFMMGDTNMTKQVTHSDPEPITKKSKVGPHVSNIELDGAVISGNNGYNVNVDQSQPVMMPVTQSQPVMMPVVQQQMTTCSQPPPGCTRVECRDTQACCSDAHHHHHHSCGDMHRSNPSCQNIDVHAVVPAPMYPQLTEVTMLRPQMPVPMPQMSVPMAMTTAAAVPALHHHHAGLYPQLGHAHTHHAQVHQPQPSVSGPPAYETTPRKM